MRNVLRKSAHKHARAKHNAAREHDPTRPVFVGKDTADDHGDEADRVCRGKYGGQVCIQFFRHRCRQAAPGVHRANAQVDQAAKEQNEPAALAQCGVIEG